MILKASDTGSFSGEETTLMDESELSWVNNEWKEWEFENDNHYLYYRQTWYRNDTSWLNMTECEMMQCGGTTTTTTSSSTTTTTA